MSQTYAIACVCITDIMQATFEPMPREYNISKEWAKGKAKKLWAESAKDDCIYIVIDQNGKSIPEHVPHLEQLRLKRIRQLQAEIDKLQEVDYAVHEKVTG